MRVLARVLVCVRVLMKLCPSAQTHEGSMNEHAKKKKRAEHRFQRRVTPLTVATQQHGLFSG